VGVRYLQGIIVIIIFILWVKGVCAQEFVNCLSKRPRIINVCFDVQWKTIENINIWIINCFLVNVQMCAGGVKSVIKSCGYFQRPLMISERAGNSFWAMRGYISRLGRREVYSSQRCCWRFKTAVRLRFGFGVFPSIVLPLPSRPNTAGRFLRLSGSYNCFGQTSGRLQTSCWTASYLQAGRE
jgi:hypothetical protein